MVPGDAATKRAVTRDEYLAMQRATDEKLWLWDGEVFPPQGASIDHERIVGNVVGILRAALGDGPCEALPSAVRVRLPGRERYVFPDALIVCGPPELEDERADTLLNPSVVFEVLSASTEAFDRGEKAAGYRSIASLRAYVLVSQLHRRVEIFVRGAGDTWTFRALGPDGALEIDLGAASVALPLSEIYRRVESGI
jgi:Uma2 family endonuclease